jgi:crotonobetainyl-CoA:carnitine CoA-transferase CaiB-like acyl-CoA transferase
VLRQPALAHDARFATNPARVAHRTELHTEITAAFASLTSDAVIARLDQAGIANARMNTMIEFWNHPQLQARNRWREVGSPAGPLRALLPPVTLVDIEPRMDPIPAVGQHSDAILRSLGYTDDEIAALRDAGAI